MRELTQRERWLVRRAVPALAVFLVLWFVFQPLQKRRAEYNKLVKDAQTLRDRIQPYGPRAEMIRKLMDEFQMDPARLTQATVVGEASAAIQKAAVSSGMQVGPVREDPARGAGGELALVQFESTGPVPATMGFLQRLPSLGYPVIIDSVQLTPAQPGQVKMSLTIVILDFQNWKGDAKPHA